MEKKKFYLNTWFIGIVFALTYFNVIFFLIGVILAALQQHSYKQYFNKYGNCEQIDANLANLEATYLKRTEKLEATYQERTKELETAYQKRTVELKTLETSLKAQCVEVAQEFSMLQTNLLVEYYKLSDYDGISSEDCKNKLALLRQDEQNLIKSNEAVSISSVQSKKVVNNNVKQILRCFNSESDNILLNLSAKNVDSMRNKLAKTFETLNKIFEVDGISLNRKLLEYKLEELNLTYTYEIKREQERELQKAIKEQMLEEEKVRREIEAQKAKIEKDQSQFSKEIDKLMAYMQKSQNDVEKQLYIDKINELDAKLKELEMAKENVLEREANAKAGFVYIISNIGSFGNDVYKIGMTRRLEPMDRIKELSSASVPFEFDVHAMIFADDAPALETALHQHFEKQSVNRVNLRKEFFKVSLDEIEKVVKENFNNTVEFTRVPVATEYRQTLNILSSEKAS